MSDYKKINGTPWHITYVGLKDGEKKRHKSRCVHYNKETGYCHKWTKKCPGSAHCKHYKEIPKEEPAGTPPEAPSVASPSSLPSAPPNPLPSSKMKEKRAGFMVDERVFHKKYGHGTIIAFSGDCVSILFEDEEIGMKTLGFSDCLKYKLLYH